MPGSCRVAGMQRPHLHRQAGSLAAAVVLGFLCWQPALGDIAQSVPVTRGTVEQAAQPQKLTLGEPSADSELSAKELEELQGRSTVRAVLTASSQSRSGVQLQNSAALTRGREVKHARERKRDRTVIPDVSLSATNELWDDKSRRRSLTEAAEAGQAQASDLSEQPPLFASSATNLQTAQAHAETNLQDHNAFGTRKLLAAKKGNPRKRSLANERSNGVSEMPDPEAAEYLSKHESQDLGSDVMTAAKLHYNGTQKGPVHPLSTDSHATTEEHITQGMNEASLANHAQQAEAVVDRYASFQSEEDEEEPEAEFVDESRGAQQGRDSQRLSQQEGFPWYTQYPPPSFPDANLTKTNHSLHTDLQLAVKSLAAEDARKKQAAQLAENAKELNLARNSQQKTVAEMTRESLKAESNAEASIWAKSAPKGPGDGGELPPGNYIFRASGSEEQTPAKMARDQLSRFRAEARVWMSSQEANLIESFLMPGDVMLEFGAGYSTMWFSQFVKEYYSIEHNETWFDEMKGQINATRKNVHLQVAPVFKGYKGWGGGFEEGTYQQFENYILAVDNFKVTRFDKVLVDGRARASCAEYVLKFLHPDSLVFIHDYQDRYFYHGTAEKYYNKVAETYDGQSLIVLRPKPEALKQAAREAVASLAKS